MQREHDTSSGTMRLALVAMPAWDVRQPFHALAIVAGIARTARMSVTVHDLNVGFYNAVDERERRSWSAQSSLWMGEELPRRLWEAYADSLVREIDAILQAPAPAIIGFSVNMTTRYFSLMAAARIKSVRPDIPILFGGVDCFPGEHHERFFVDAGSSVDILCTGEAEHAFRDFLEAFQRTGSYQTSVPGFLYRDAGRIVQTGDADIPLLRNEKMPLPAYDLFPLETYTHKGTLPFYLSRGCVYKCNFCSERPNFRFFRSRRAEEAFEELLGIYAYAHRFTDVPTFNLSDSNFNANKRELERFADLIITRGIKVHWGGQAHFDEGMTAAFLEKLKRSGLVSVFWGFESASQHVVDLMNKSYSQAVARRIIDDCIRLQISQNLPVIIGYPGETPEDLCDTVAFILQYKNKKRVTINAPSLLMVRPNAPMYKNYQKHGLANNRYRDWQTADGKNTLHVRIFRRFIALQAHANHTLSMDGLQGLLELPRISVNAQTVSTDSYNVLHELFSRAGTLGRFHAIIDAWNEDIPVLGNQAWIETAASRTESTASAVRTKYYQKWLLLEKDADLHRQKIYRTVLASLADMKVTLEKMGNCERMPDDKGPVD